MALPGRAVHASGGTRVCVDGGHICTGGADGVIALYSQKRWPLSAPLWVRQCHDGAVTSVVLHSALGLAVSCGRDGKVILHESVFESSTSRVVCRVTGEVRCVLFDAERRRIFIAGDSLRALHMSAGRFDIHTIPLSVPHPLVALALSPCGELLAMASASGAVGIVSVNAPVPTAATAPTAVSESPRSVRIAVPNVLSAMAKREDAAAHRLSWGRGGDGALLLFVPGLAETKVMRFDEAPQPRLHHVGSIDGFGMTDLIGVSCHTLSAHIWCAVLVSKSGFVVAKVDVRKWSVARLKGESFTSTSITDAHLDASTGNFVVGTEDGRITFLQKEAPRATRRGEADGVEGASIKNKEQKALKEERNEKENKKKVLESFSQAKKENRKDTRHLDHNDSESEDNAGSGSSESSEDSVGSSSSSTMESKEDLRVVVQDLKRTNPSYIENDDEERQSRWRNGDPREALRAAQAEEKRRPQRSAYLDDEAEESSDDDHAEDDDGDDDEEGGDGANARGGTYNRHRNVDNEEGEDVDDEEEEGAASVITSGARSVGSLLHDDGADENKSGRVHGNVHGTVRTVEDYSFQISATPTGPEGSCYLAYNSVGYIHCTGEGTTIHFHDMSLQAVRVLEKGTILMATLSPVGAGFVIAQDTPNDIMMDSVDDLPRLTVYYRTFVAIGAQSEWRVKLHPGETVRCMTAGIRYTAVATNRYLRLFSLSGLELAVLSLFPRIVSMVGTNSSKLMASYRADFDPLAVCYMDGGELKAQVLDVGSRAVVVPACVVPLTEASDGSTHQLQWMGWSEDGPLHVADTAGVLRMLTLNWGGGWVPVYDPRGLADQTCNLWIWGVCDEALLAYRSPKSDPPYPASVAGGLPAERVRLFLPLARSGTEREMVTWDHILRREIRADEVKRRSTFYTPAIAKFDALHDKKIMELFTHALKEQHTTRALDLATYLELRDNIELCAREANTQGHGQLVHKLLALLEVRVKAKRKRKCTLPLEGSVVSERERDLLLRRFLAKEKSQAQAPETNEKETAEPQAERTAAEAPPPVAPPTAPPAAPPETSVVTKRHVTFTDAAPTTVTTPSKRTPPRPAAKSIISSPAKTMRPIPHTAPPPSSSSASSASVVRHAAAETPVSPAKPVNPFSRAAKTTVTLSSTTTHNPLQQSQSSPQMEMPRVRSADSVVVLGESQPSPHVIAHACKTPSPECDNDNAAEAAAVRESTGGALPNGLSEQRRPAVNPFFPKAVPARAFADATPPVDPFLDTSDGATLDAVLADVGHEGRQPQNTAPLSASFGEALRKRYREEEDEDDQEECIAVPRIEIR